MRFRYQEPDAKITLRQGLAEYYAEHPGLFRPDQLSKDSARFFRAHDIAHVIFGLDTTLRDEALADVWTIFGTDVGLRRYARYIRTNPEAKMLMKQIGLARTVFISLQILPQLPSVWFRARRMSRKWVWDNNEDFMGVPLREIRTELNLRLRAS